MDDEELVTNLDRVAKNIDTALKRLRESTEPMNASAAQLPLAKQYLADLKRMTEEGAHVVMDVTEALQEAQGRGCRYLAVETMSPRAKSQEYDLTGPEPADFMMWMVRRL